MTTMLAIAAIIGIGVLYVLVPVMLEAYRKFRGPRLVTCPETAQTAAVEVDAPHAALAAAVGTTAVRVGGCSRWPEHGDCGQECLRQIERPPKQSLVQSADISPRTHAWHLGPPI